MRFFRQQNNHLLDFDWSIASIYETLTDECAPFTITLIPDKDVESTKAIAARNLTNPTINSGTASRNEINRSSKGNHHRNGYSGNRSHHRR
jgi:hypothetical protein